MVLRFLFRLLNSERVIERLADSAPIRRAAKWVVYVFHKAKAIKADESFPLKDQLNNPAVKKASQNIEESLKKIVENLENKLKK